MDSTLALLLNLQSLALASPADQATLAIVPAEDIITDALAGIFPERELQQMRDLLARTSRDGTVGVAASWRMANDVAHAIRAKGASTDQIASRATLNRVFEDLFMLRRIAGSQMIGHIDLRIESVALFQYIPRLEIEPTAGKPATVIIGPLSQAITQHDITTSPKNDSYIERRTEIVYVATSPYPRLNLNLRSRRGARDVKNARSDWIQRPFPEYDLEICTFQERLVGSIQTRPRELPYSVEGEKLSIILPKEPDTSLLETSILDEQGNPLIRYVRVVIARKAIAYQA